MYKQSIIESLDNKTLPQDIARKVYIIYPTYAFIDKEDTKYEILSKISEYFKIPINHILICGSSQTGESYHKDSKFNNKDSDLDIALVDNNLFCTYAELIHKITNGFKDLTKFEDSNAVKLYKKRLVKGFIKLDEIPTCSERANVLIFFRSLSKEYKNLFKNISAGVYSSTFYFEYKQSESIIKLKTNKTY